MHTGGQLLDGEIMNDVAKGGRRPFFELQAAYRAQRTPRALRGVAGVVGDRPSCRSRTKVYVPHFMSFRCPLGPGVGTKYRPLTIRGMDG